MKTYFQKPRSVKRQWFCLDAKDIPLGRVAGKAAVLLRGKHKGIYTPHQEIGDYVIIINAAEAKMTGRKSSRKLYHRHSGYPGGLKTFTYNQLKEKNPVLPMEKAVKGMLPRGPLGYKLFKNVKVYAGGSHGHQAQKPRMILLGESASSQGEKVNG